MESKNICPICLRTNRTLKVINSTLSVYHDELTDYTLLLKNPHYCIECECLLRKTYNFHQKCRKAASILQKWMKTTATEKTSANKLYLKLPSINLDIWMQANNKIFKYSCSHTPDLSHAPQTEGSAAHKLDIATMNDEDINSKIQSETMIKIKLKHEQQQPYEIIGFHNLNNGPDDTINVFKKLTHQNGDDNVINNSDVLSYIPIEGNKIDRENMTIQASYTEQTPHSMLDIDDVKHNFKNKSIALKLAHDSSDKSGINDNDDINMKLLCLNNGNKNDIFETDDEDMMMVYSDDASLNSDYDSDDCLCSPKSNDEERNSFCDKKCINNVISQLENMDKTLDSLYKSWEITTLKGLGSLPKDNLMHALLTEKGKGREKDKRKSVKSKLQQIASNLDLINEMCVNYLGDYKLSLCTPKERLIAKLERELSSSQHGLNKNVILSCVHKVSDVAVLRLLDLMHGTKHLKPAAVKLLKMMEDREQYVKYESVFDIELLLTDQDKLDEFERRTTYQCYVNALFKCVICHQGFKSEGLLHYHKKYHDERQRKFSCSICHVRNHKIRDYRKHKLLHQEVFKCRLCPLVTYYRNSMVNHYEQHNGRIYKCDKCNNTYKSKSSLLYHERRAHPRGVHVCAACGHGFVSQLGLHGHVARKHQGEAEADAEADGCRYECEECALSFRSEAARRTHRALAHGARPRRSSPPGAKGNRPVLRKQRKKPTMTCPECEAEGHSYGWMVSHLREEHPALDPAAVYRRRHRYLCDVCGKAFLSRSYLEQHLAVHEGARFPCPSCSKQFSSRAQARLHAARHAPPAHCCERCGRYFRSWANLYNHMRIHTGDRRYKCPVCAKGFLHRYSLREHVRGVHLHQRRDRRRRLAATARTAAAASPRRTPPPRQLADPKATELGAQVIIHANSSDITQPSV